jgi:hypothetical protein
MRMAGKRDPRIGLMITGFHAILASLPTVLELGEHGPLTLDEIDQAAELMDRLAAEIQAERAQPDV